ncbi:MAG: phosphatidylinositol mannoside acyltransferase [Acidimicrobiales bacterium]
MKLDPVLLYRAGAAGAHALPPSLVGAIASSVATAVSHQAGSADRRRLVGRHLRRAVGPDLTGPALESAIDEAFGSYARYWAESLRLPGTRAEVIDDGMSWEGIGRISRAVADGRGAILALPHLGGWEWGGFWMATRGFAMTVVVEALEPPELFEWFAGFRRSLDMQVIPVGSGAAMAVVRALRSGGVVCLLCDRNIAGAGGVEVEFFGERTELPGGPATLAMRTGAALLPSAVYFDGPGHRHRAVVRPEIVPRPLPKGSSSADLRAEVARMTQVLAGDLEVFIRHAPTQWHLMQPNWPSDPGYSR